MNSNFASLNWLDALKGFILAVITALVIGVYQALQAGTIAFTWVFWQPVVLSAVGAGIAYLVKNFLTNSTGQPLTIEKP